MKNKIVSRLLAITTMSTLLSGCVNTEPVQLEKTDMKESIVGEKVVDKVVEQGGKILEKNIISENDEPVVQDNEQTEKDTSSNPMEKLRETMRTDFVDKVILESKPIEEPIGKEANLMEEDTYNNKDNTKDIKEETSYIESTTSEQEPDTHDDSATVVEEYVYSQDVIRYVYGPAPFPELPNNDIEDYSPVDDAPRRVYGPAEKPSKIGNIEKDYSPVDDEQRCVYGPAEWFEKDAPFDNYEPVDDMYRAVYGPAEKPFEKVIDKSEELFENIWNNDNSEEDITTEDIDQNDNIVED